MSLVHAFGGTWGLIAAPLLDTNGILVTGSKESAKVNDLHASYLAAFD